jgi:hypothetical protein
MKRRIPSVNKIVLESRASQPTKNYAIVNQERKSSPNHQNIKSVRQPLIKNSFNKLKIHLIFSNWIKLQQSFKKCGKVSNFASISSTNLTYSTITITLPATEYKAVIQYFGMMPKAIQSFKQITMLSRAVTKISHFPTVIYNNQFPMGRIKNRATTALSSISNKCYSA